MRHYEILANGCIPYFEDIASCPPNTLGLFPKKMIEEGNALCEKMIGGSTIHIQEYTTLLTKLMDYLKEHLTTKQIAKYVLKTAKCENASKILFLSSNTDPDYLRCLTLHGFKQLFGDKCHDYPAIPHIYKNANIEYKTLYGKGITYTNLLDPLLHNEEFDQNVETQIKTRFYDVVIYGSYHRGMPLIELVLKHYNTNEIIIMCGEDIHTCNHEKIANKGFYTFVREL